jgi:hypothetical protein
MAMKTRSHFTFRVDTWTPDGEILPASNRGALCYQFSISGISPMNASIADYFVALERHGRPTGPFEKDRVHP